jgi:hypothetical protein
VKRTLSVTVGEIDCGVCFRNVGGTAEDGSLTGLVPCVGLSPGAAVVALDTVLY